jgi:hypothetical protein
MKGAVIPTWLICGMVFSMMVFQLVSAEITKNRGNLCLEKFMRSSEHEIIGGDLYCRTDPNKLRRYTIKPQKLRKVKTK